MAALEATWPVLSAQIDDLAKLVEELAQTVTQVDLDASVDNPHHQSSVVELLKALRDSHR